MFMLIAVIGLLIFLHVSKIIKPVESFLVNILSPVFSSFYSVSSGLRSTFSEQTGKRDLTKINNMFILYMLLFDDNLPGVHRFRHDVFRKLKIHHSRVDENDSLLEYTDVEYVSGGYINNAGSW